MIAVLMRATKIFYYITMKGVESSVMSGLFFQCQAALQRWAFHIKSVWLFTYSDLKTIVFPSAASGILNGIAVSLENEQVLSSLNLSTPEHIFKRAPLVLAWVWLNLLPFNIDNQRQPKAIQEDLLNKPWRTLPSKRLSPGFVKGLMLVLYPIAVFVSFRLGALTQCLALIFLGYWYNDLGGGDGNPLIRNLINACGFVCFSSGAMQVAIRRPGTDSHSTESALGLYGWWFLIIACIVVSTVQTQDMCDQRGDTVRDRKTIPLVIGDAPARWTIAIGVAVWCCVTPWLWRSPTTGYLGPVILGAIIAGRTLWKRSEKADKTTFLLWNVWLVSLYFLPLIKALTLRS